MASVRRRNVGTRWMGRFLTVLDTVLDTVPGSRSRTANRTDMLISLREKVVYFIWGVGPS